MQRYIGLSCCGCGEYEPDRIEQRSELRVPGADERLRNGRRSGDVNPVSPVSTGGLDVEP